MSRKHVFAIVVLLGAAAVAGLLALTRTTTAAMQASSTQITAKSRSLDRLEASLRRALAHQPPAVPPARAAAASAAPGTTLVDSGAVLPGAGEHEEEHGDDEHADEQEHEGDPGDDEHAEEHEHEGADD